MGILEYNAKVWFFIRWRRISRLFISILVWFTNMVLSKKDIVVSAKNVQYLADLDEIRGILLEQTGELLGHARQECVACRGGCCRNTSNCFSIFDYCFYLATNRGRVTPSNDLYSVHYHGWAFFRMLKSLFYLDPGLKEIKVQPEGKELGCLFATNSGCFLGESERPILCLTFLCRDMIWVMDMATMRRLSKLFSKLEMLQLKVFLLLLRESLRTNKEVEAGMIVSSKCYHRKKAD